MNQQANAVNEPVPGQEFTQEDIEKNKTVSAFAYLLFFLPLIACPESPFGKFHANQGLLLLLTCILGIIILNLIPVIGWILSPLFSILMLAVALMGLVNTLNGKAKELPLIGKYRILK